VISLPDPVGYHDIKRSVGFTTPGCQASPRATGYTIPYHGVDTHDLFLPGCNNKMCPLHTALGIVHVDITLLIKGLYTDETAAYLRGRYILMYLSGGVTGRVSETDSVKESSAYLEMTLIHNSRKKPGL
jgi:hypothetical protein